MNIYETVKATSQFGRSFFFNIIIIIIIITIILRSILKVCFYDLKGPG